MNLETVAGTEVLENGLGKNAALLTRKPWEVIGISRASWFRLKNRPHPVKVPGMQVRQWRVKDLIRYVNGFALNKKAGKPIGVAKPIPEPSAN